MSTNAYEMFNDAQIAELQEFAKAVIRKLRKTASENNSKLKLADGIERWLTLSFDKRCPIRQNRYAIKMNQQLGKAHT